MCREEGVDFAQGFLIGKPVPYDEFVAAFMPSGVPAAPERTDCGTGHGDTKETREPMQWLQRSVGLAIIGTATLGRARPVARRGGR